jgi:hypothetical protein
MKRHWVILAPNDVYLSDSAEAKVDLSSLGEWWLQTTSFGTPRSVPYSVSRFRDHGDYRPGNVAWQSRAEQWQQRKRHRRI